MSARRKWKLVSRRLLCHAVVAELADALSSGGSGNTRESSNLSNRTNPKMKDAPKGVFFFARVESRIENGEWRGAAVASLFVCGRRKIAGSRELGAACLAFVMHRGRDVCASDIFISMRHPKPNICFCLITQTVPLGRFLVSKLHPASSSDTWSRTWCRYFPLRGGCFLCSGGLWPDRWRAESFL